MPTGLDLFLPSSLGFSLAIIWVLVILSLTSGKIDIPGAVTGGLLATAIYMGGGWNTLSILASFFVIGTFATQWKYKWKAANELAQANGGRRGVMHVVSNGGLAGTCGLIGWVMPEIGFMAQGMAAASLAAALSDTLSSEFGNVYGSRYMNAVTFKKDKRGKDGVISIEGSLFGFLGSLLIALQYGLLVSPTINVLWVFIAGILGNLVDSVLGATIQQKGYLNNHEVNILNTLSGGTCYALLYMAHFYLTG